MAGAGPLPSDIQPVANETRDRIITGLVTLVPFLALGLAAWQVWGSALHWSDVFLFLGMYFFTGIGITVGPDGRVVSTGWIDGDIDFGTGVVPMGHRAFVLWTRP